MACRFCLFIWCKGMWPACFCLVDAKVPLDRVASLLGHESVDTTRIYTTHSEQDLQQEVEKIALV